MDKETHSKKKRTIGLRHNLFLVSVIVFGIFVIACVVAYICVSANLQANYKNDLLNLIIGLGLIFVALVISNALLLSAAKIDLKENDKEYCRSIANAGEISFKTLTEDKVLFDKIKPSKTYDENATYSKFKSDIYTKYKVLFQDENFLYAIKAKIRHLNKVKQLTPGVVIPVLIAIITLLFESDGLMGNAIVDSVSDIAKIIPMFNGIVDIIQPAVMPGMIIYIAYYCIKYLSDLENDISYYETVYEIATSPSTSQK